jgi:hypothetical protein
MPQLLAQLKQLLSVRRNPVMLKPRKQRLPAKLSDLIILALTDLEKVEASNDVYIVNMNYYHGKFEDEATDRRHRSRCRVCLAGAVMASTLEVPPDDTKFPMDFGCSDGKRLMALNDIRSGFVEAALDRINQSWAGSSEYHVPEYKQNPTGFKSAIRVIAADLAAAGY